MKHSTSVGGYGGEGEGVDHGWVGGGGVRQLWGLQPLGPPFPSQKRNHSAPMRLRIARLLENAELILGQTRRDRYNTSPRLYPSSCNAWLLRYFLIHGKPLDITFTHFDTVSYTHNINATQLYMNRVAMKIPPSDLTVIESWPRPSILLVKSDF